MILFLMPDLNILEYNIQILLQLKSWIGKSMLCLKYDWDNNEAYYINAW